MLHHLLLEHLNDSRRQLTFPRFQPDQPATHCFILSLNSSWNCFVRFEPDLCPRSLLEVYKPHASGVGLVRISAVVQLALSKHWHLREDRKGNDDLDDRRVRAETRILGSNSATHSDHTDEDYQKRETGRLLQASLCRLERV
jgi:hypothetical protein